MTDDDDPDIDSEYPHSPDRPTGWGEDRDTDTDTDTTDTNSPLQPDDGFYHCGVHVTQGRVFVDPEIERDDEYLAIKEVVPDEMAVWVLRVIEDPHGRLESRHGTFTRSSPCYKRDWTEIYGRLIPR